MQNEQQICEKKHLKSVTVKNTMRFRLIGMILFKREKISGESQFFYTVGVNTKQ